jgi:hypothetical protein
MELTVAHLDWQCKAATAQQTAIYKTDHLTKSMSIS